MSLIIHAPNVHQGGGRRLLQFLLASLDGKSNVKVILDSRFCPHPALANVVTEIRIKSTMLGRLSAEWRLRSLATSNDVVLCFGNLPPLFKLKSATVLFLQNRYLVAATSFRGFTIFQKLRLMTERFWLAAFRTNADRVIVQSPTMQREVFARFGI